MPCDPEVLARRWFDEVWNARRHEAIDELLDDDGVCQSELGPLRGKAEFRDRLFAPFLAALPDLSIAIEDTVAQGDRIVVRWLATGTHLGDGLGIPPTGRPVSIRGASWLHFRDGKLFEGWDFWSPTALVASLRGPS